MTPLHKTVNPYLTPPMMMTAFRCGLTIPVYLLLRDYQAVPALSLLALAMLTDVLDGFLARRMNQCTPAGAYLDAAADFAVILAAFAALVAHDIFPLWLPLLLAGMFLQFLLTSTLGKPVYDPVGKYLGAVLYLVLVVLLLFPDYLLSYALLGGIISMCAISLATRVRYLRRLVPDTAIIRNRLTPT
jgi:CDP-diacylglycerol--glycerol-3-phosphate 3-phosphatidyltransferase/cardiolipin synthase